MNARKSGHVRARKSSWMLKSLDIARFCLGRSGHRHFPSGMVWTYRLSVWDLNLGYNTDQNSSTEPDPFQVRWVPEACTHVISQIGFGLGKLKIVGGRGLTKKFVLPPLGNSQKIHILTGYQIKTKLAFPWFVVWVICGEKPWLCPNTDGFASSSGGRNL